MEGPGSGSKRSGGSSPPPLIDAAEPAAGSKCSRPCPAGVSVGRASDSGEGAASSVSPGGSPTTTALQSEYLAAPEAELTATHGASHHGAALLRVHMDGPETNGGSHVLCAADGSGSQVQLHVVKDWDRQTHRDSTIASAERERERPPRWDPCANERSRTDYQYELDWAAMEYQGAVDPDAPWERFRDAAFCARLRALRGSSPYSDPSRAPAAPKKLPVLYARSDHHVHYHFDLDFKHSAMRTFAWPRMGDTLRARCRHGGHKCPFLFRQPVMGHAQAALTIQRAYRQHRFRLQQKRDCLAAAEEAAKAVKEAEKQAELSPWELFEQHEQDCLAAEQEAAEQAELFERQEQACLAADQEADEEAAELVELAVQQGFLPFQRWRLLPCLEHCSCLTCQPPFHLPQPPRPPVIGPWFQPIHRHPPVDHWPRCAIHPDCAARSAYARGDAEWSGHNCRRGPCSRCPASRIWEVNRPDPVYKDDERPAHGQRTAPRKPPDSKCVHKSSGCEGVLCSRVRAVPEDDWDATSTFMTVQEARLGPNPLQVEPAFVTLHHADPALRDQLGHAQEYAWVYYKDAHGAEEGLGRLTDASIDDLLRRINVVPQADKSRADWRVQALSDAIQHDRAVAAACSARAAAGKALPEYGAKLLYPPTHPAIACNCHRFDPALRTDPQHCHHPSHFLARGKAGELRELLKMLGIPTSNRAAKPAPEHRFKYTLVKFARKVHSSRCKCVLSSVGEHHGDSDDLGPDLSADRTFGKPHQEKKHRISVAESVQHLCNYWQQPARSNHHWQAVAVASKRRAGKKGGSAPCAKKKKEQTPGAHRWV